MKIRDALGVILYKAKIYWNILERVMQYISIKKTFCLYFLIYCTTILLIAMLIETHNSHGFSLTRGLIKLNTYS